MAQNYTAEEDAIKANKPMTVTDGSVSFTSAPGDSSTVDVNGDIFLLNGTTANVTLTLPRRYPSTSWARRRST